MNAFILKLIACFTMFIDHLGYVIFNGNTSYFNYIGRLAFPIFAFQISQGFIHTKNVKNYVFRLFIFALVSQIPFMLFHSIISDDLAINVIFTLLLGLISIIIYAKFPKKISIPLALLIGIIAELANTDYGFYGVAIIFLFYAFRDNKALLCFSFIFATFLSYLSQIVAYSSFGLSLIIQYYLPFMFCTFLAIIPILLYNKEKGPNTKYLFYLFFPLHLIALYIVSIF